MRHVGHRDPEELDEDEHFENRRDQLDELRRRQEMHPCDGVEEFDPQRDDGQDRHDDKGESDSDLDDVDRLVEPFENHEIPLQMRADLEG